MIEKKETRNEAIARALEEFRDTLAAAIESTTLSYERLGHIYGVSGSTVYKLAKARGLRREADKKTVVKNG